MDSGLFSEHWPPSLDDRYAYMERLCQALITYGAPLHLVEKLANNTANNLGFFTPEFDWRYVGLIKIRIQSVSQPERVQDLVVRIGSRHRHLYKILDIYDQVRGDFSAAAHGAG
jgi:hypothetical protein